MGFVSEPEDHLGGSVEIPSRDGARCLSFLRREGDYFAVSIERGNPQASVRVWGYTDCDLLVDLFASMARDWRGWEGKRDWASIEGEFRISASTTRTGVVTLRIELRQYDDEWEVSVPVIVEAGQLESIAFRVANFFSSR